MRITPFVAVGTLLAMAGSTISRAGPVEDVSRGSLMEALRALPLARSVRGEEANRTGLRQTEQLLAARLKAMGYDPIIQPIEWVSPVQRLDQSSEPAKDAAPGGAKKAAPPPTPDPAPTTTPAPEFWNNIIVEIPGKELTDEVVLIGAHFDAVAGSPGADDNGSGTAALLELARVLKDQPMKRTVRLVFFNLEEVGLIGSLKYVASYNADTEKTHRIVGMVSLEMIGYFCTEEGCQKSPIPAIKGVYEPPTKGDTLAAVTIKANQEFNSRFAAAFESASEGLKITKFDFMPLPIPDILRSDHAPFMAAGVPAIMLTDTSNFRNPHYHTPTDTADTLDQGRYEKAVRGITAATMALAEPWKDEAAAPSTPK